MNSRTRTMVKTGTLSYVEEDTPPEVWKQALILGALVQRNGGPITVTMDELTALIGCTLHVEHHIVNDEIVVGLTREGG